MNVEFVSPQHQQGPGLADYVSVVRRRIWHVVVPLAFFAAAGFGIATVMPKEYLAKTEVLVEDPDSMVGTMFTPVGYSVPHKQLLVTIVPDSKRAEFLVPLIDQYGITEGYNPSDPRERTRMIEKIRRRLSVLWTPAKTGPDFITFTYEGRDSVRVTEFVNAVRTKWQDEFTERYKAAVRAVETNVRSVFLEAERKYTEAQTQLKNFQEANGTDYFGKDPGTLATTLLSSLERDRDNFETQLRGEEAALRNVLQQLDSVRPMTQTDASKTRNPLWTAQSSQVTAIEAQIKLLETNYTDEWPKLKALKLQLAEERTKLEAIEQFATDTVVQATNPQWVQLTAQKNLAETTIAGLRDKIDKTKTRIAQLEKDVKVIPEKTAQAQKLRDAVDNAYLIYEKAARARETMIATRERVAAKAKSFIRVMSETTPEEAKFAIPVYPNYLMFVGIGAFLGLLIGGGVAFIGEFAAASFTTANQVRYSLQVPVLGEVSPLVTVAETRTRKRKRAVILVALLAVVAIVVLAHVLWFDPDLRSHLPPFARDVMRRIYGAGVR
jgi:uncharacterized protein involved in exopolysaccharide biosynthesis